VTQECGARLPSLFGKDKGWECDGTGLVIALISGEPVTACGVPMVIRADLFDRLAGEGIVNGHAPFFGGDHVHAMLQPAGRRKNAAVSDFRMLPNGNIEMTAVLMPEAYAALRSLEDTEKLRPVDAVNLALMVLGGVAKKQREAGVPLRDAVELDDAEGKADVGQPGTAV